MKQQPLKVMMVGRLPSRSIRDCYITWVAMTLIALERRALMEVIITKWITFVP